MVAAERWDEAGTPVLEAVRKARRDALPEHTQYADTGCDVHPRCLTCPLVRCRYDEPGGARKLFSEDRDRAIVSMHREGAPVDAIARRFGVSRRTVFRALARERRATPPSLSDRAQGERRRRGGF
jgi:transposase-like protein